MTTISPKQRLFVRARMVGASIKDSAAAAGISERQAHRWLKNPAFAAEYERVSNALYGAEQEATKQAAIDSIRSAWNERYH